MQRIFEGNLSSEQECKKVSLSKIKVVSVWKKLILLVKMHKILSVLSLAGFIVSSMAADATFQPANQPSQVASDTQPQTSYVPAATTYQNSDAISVRNCTPIPSERADKLWNYFTDSEQSGVRSDALLQLRAPGCSSGLRQPIRQRICRTSTRGIFDSNPETHWSRSAVADTRWIREITFAIVENYFRDFGETCGFGSNGNWNCVLWRYVWGCLKMILSLWNETLSIFQIHCL